MVNRVYRFLFWGVFSAILIFSFQNCEEKFGSLSDSATISESLNNGGAYDGKPEIELPTNSIRPGEVIQVKIEKGTAPFSLRAEPNIVDIEQIDDRTFKLTIPQDLDFNSIRLTVTDANNLTDSESIFIIGKTVDFNYYFPRYFKFRRNSMVFADPIGVSRFDLKGNYLKKIPFESANEGHLLKALDIDSSGNTYAILERLNKYRFVKFDSKSESFEVLSAPQFKLLRSPSDILAHNGRLYISDYSLGKIFIFDLDGNWLETWGPQENNLELNKPMALILNEQVEALLVIDQSMNNLKALNYKGEVLAQFSLRDEPLFSNQTTLEIATDAKGNVYVSSTDDPQWGSERIVSGPRSIDIYLQKLKLIIDTNKEIQLSEKTILGFNYNIKVIDETMPFHLKKCLSISPEDLIVSCNNRSHSGLSVYSQDGKENMSFFEYLGQREDKDFKMMEPTSLTLTKDDQFFVHDHFARKIYHYNHNYQLVNTIDFISALESSHRDAGYVNFLFEQSTDVLQFRVYDEKLYLVISVLRAGVKSNYAFIFNLDGELDRVTPLNDVEVVEREKVIKLPDGSSVVERDYDTIRHGFTDFEFYNGNYYLLNSDYHRLHSFDIEGKLLERYDVTVCLQPQSNTCRVKDRGTQRMVLVGNELLIRHTIPQKDRDGEFTTFLKVVGINKDGSLGPQSLKELYVNPKIDITGEGKFLSSVSSSLDPSEASNSKILTSYPSIAEKLSFVKIDDFNSLSNLFIHNTKGYEKGALYKPQAVVVNSKGDVIVADSGNFRLQVFERAVDRPSLVTSKD